jgi:hypothetical protein
MGERSVMSCEDVDTVGRLAHPPMVGLSASASRLGEQIEVPMDQLIAPEHEQDYPD